MFVFQEIWCALFSWNSCFEICPFALLTTIFDVWLGPKYVAMYLSCQHWTDTYSSNYWKRKLWYWLPQTLYSFFYEIQQDLVQSKKKRNLVWIIHALKQIIRYFSLFIYLLLYFNKLIKPFFIQRTFLIG